MQEVAQLSQFDEELYKVCNAIYFLCTIFPRKTMFFGMNFEYFK